MAGWGAQRFPPNPYWEVRGRYLKGSFLGIFFSGRTPVVVAGTGLFFANCACGTANLLPSKPKPKPSAGLEMEAWRRTFLASQHGADRSRSSSQKPQSLFSNGNGIGRWAGLCCVTSPVFPELPNLEETEGLDVLLKFAGLQHPAGRCEKSPFLGSGQVLRD